MADAATTSTTPTTPGMSGTPLAAPRAPGAPAQQEGTVKDTLVSLIISLAMAFIAKSYVVEAFVIPTGSMAPTLLGQHMQFRSEQTGYEWTVNPWHFFPIGPGQSLPYPVQGAGDRNRAGANLPPPVVTDPMTTSRVSPRISQRPDGLSIGGNPRRLRWGDRILVQKALYEVFPPERWDVVVFKNPENVAENFIKRLIGLPNEQIWLADGDVFARSIALDGQGTVQNAGEWGIQRKPDRIQQALWRTVFSSEYTPRNPMAQNGRRYFHTPWVGEGWETADRRAYRRDSAEPSFLSWSTETWPVNDWVPYNDMPIVDRTLNFPIADLRVRGHIRPDQAGLSVGATIVARGHEFRAALEPDAQGGHAARVEMRSAGQAGWTVLDQRHVTAALEAGELIRFEFWHVDQSLSLWLDGERVAAGTYGWGPSDRLRYSTGHAAEEYEEITSGSPIFLPGTYRAGAPSIRWSFSGSPLTMYRVGLDRDLYYRPAPYNSGPNSGLAGLGTHPLRPATLNHEQFFVLGDNSPSSKDGRLWDQLDPWVRRLDPTEGVVNRKLMLGKAFFVYFPAPYRFMNSVPIPDFGRMRFIR